MKKILVFTLFSLIAIWAWWFLSSYQNFGIRQIEAVSPGGGLCLLYAYDGQGNRYDYFYGQLDTRSSGRQLYLLSPENLVRAGYGETVEPATCFEYPENVSTRDISNYGVPLVPVGFSASFPAEKIQKGNSLVLTAQIAVVDQSRAERWIAIPEGGSTTIRFRIEQANFIFSPTNDEIAPARLRRENPAVSQWVVAPKESASGNQTILIVALGDQFDAAYNLEVEVVPTYGDLPVYVGVITGLVGFLASSLDIVERTRRLLKRKKAAFPADQPPEK
jgi:hypothetical protein